MIPRFDERRIMCAVCQRPVERVESYRCEMTQGIKFRVFCHGRTETSELDDSTFATADAITPATAFAQPQLA